MIYILYFILLLLFLKIEADSLEERTFVRYLIPFVYILLVGFRGANVGVDTPVYYQHYYSFGQFGCDFVEKGFDWINRICFACGLGSWSLFIICAAMTIIPVMYTLNKLPKDEYIATALLFYTSSFATICNGMRQAVVCGVFLMVASSFFYHDFEENKYAKKIFIYIIAISLCTLIHASAFLLLPLFWLYKIKINENIVLVLYLLSFAFIFIDVSAFIPELSLGNRDYSRFAESESSQASWLGFIISTTLNLIIFWGMKRADFFNRLPMLSYLVLLAFIFKNVGFNFPFVSRITMYFSWFVYVAVGKLYMENIFGGRLTYRGINFIKVIYLIYFALLVNTFTSAVNRLNPYTFYWENSYYEQYID